MEDCDQSGAGGEHMRNDAEGAAERRDKGGTGDWGALHVRFKAFRINRTEAYSWDGACSPANGGW